MALKDKLENISQQINVEKEEKKKNEESERLKPIREEIKKKEKEIFDLEIIKNSLDFKSDQNKKNEGMTEYAESTTNKKKKTKAELESIANANSEALEKMGVKNIDDLTSNPEFAEEEEVVAYKEADAQESDLVLSDTKLKNRLAKLGIEINDDNFSYKTASEEISKRLDVLNNELIAEKFKTPEGKEEAEEMLIKHFAKEIPKMELGTVQKDVSKIGTEVFSVSIKIGGNVKEFEIYDRAKFKKSPYIEGVLPNDFAEKSKKYGVEFVAEALKKAYSANLKEAFVKVDGNINEGARGALEKLKNVSPETAREAYQLAMVFEKKKGEALKIVDDKNEEFKELKGLPISDFGFKEISLFGLYNKQDEKDLQRLRYPNFFPKNESQLNYLEVKKHIEKRIETIDKYIEELRTLTVDEVKEYNSLPWTAPRGETKKYNEIGKYIHELHKDKKEKCFSDDIYYDNQKKNVRQFGDYYSAQEYFQEKIKKSNDVEKKISEKISEVVDFETLKFELGGENYGRRDVMGDFDGLIYDINKNRGIADNALNQIAIAGFDLPKNEKIEVRDSNIYFPDRKAEVDRITNDLENKKKELQTKKDELTKKRNSKPSLFGKNKWQEELSSMEEDEEEIKNEIKALESDISSKNKNVYKRYTDYFQYANLEAEKTIKEYSASGTGPEVFDELKQKLEEIAKKSLPDEVYKKYKKAKDLQTEIKR